MMKHPKLLSCRLPVVLFCFAAIVSPALSQTVTQIAPLPSQWGYSGSWFLDAEKGFLCGGMKSLYRTMDGGISWTKTALPGYADAPVYSVRFFDSNIGIASGNSAPDSRDIFRTTDGGTTWTEVPEFSLGRFVVFPGLRQFDHWIHWVQRRLGSDHRCRGHVGTPFLLSRLPLDDGHDVSGRQYRVCLGRASLVRKRGFQNHRWRPYLDARSARWRR